MADNSGGSCEPCKKKKCKVFTHSVRIDRKKGLC